jgi:hypothetical protein
MSRRTQSVLFGLAAAVASLWGWSRPPAGPLPLGIVTALLIGAAVAGLAWLAARRDERGAP